MSQNTDLFQITDRDYVITRSQFRNIVDKVVAYSVGINGTPSLHGRQYWSSLLLSKLTLSSMTVDRIAPHIPRRGRRELWDLGSVATLVRGIAENYLLLRWLCVETHDEELWKLRITLLTIMDNRSRYRMVDESIDAAPPPDFLNAQMALAQQLHDMPMFNALSQNKQRELLKGDRLPFIQDDVINSLDMDAVIFRRVYRYLSAFVHTGTVSFFRMEIHGRGNGEKNAYEVQAIATILELAVIILTRTMADMDAIHGQPQPATS